MLPIVIVLAFGVLTAVALVIIIRSGGGTVTERDVGGINSFDAYYGKDAHTYGGTQPCEKCVSKGCIGLGLCRCICHRAEAK